MSDIWGAICIKCKKYRTHWQDRIKYKGRFICVECAKEIREEKR